MTNLNSIEALTHLFQDAWWEPGWPAPTDWVPLLAHFDQQGWELLRVLKGMMGLLCETWWRKLRDGQRWWMASLLPTALLGTLIWPSVQGDHQLILHLINQSIREYPGVAHHSRDQFLCTSSDLQSSGPESVKCYWYWLVGLGSRWVSEWGVWKNSPPGYRSVWHEWAGSFPITSCSCCPCRYPWLVRAWWMTVAREKWLAGKQAGMLAACNAPVDIETQDKPQHQNWTWNAQSYGA